MSGSGKKKVEFKWNDFSSDPDGLYFLARDIDKHRDRLDMNFGSSGGTNPLKLYNSLSEGAKANFNRPGGTHKAYFTMVKLLEEDFERYEGVPGYLRLAQDLQKTVPHPNLGLLWRAAAKYRKDLGWEEKIDLPLDTARKIRSLLRNNKDKYRGDKGQILLAQDLRDDPDIGTVPHLTQIWSGAQEYRKRLGWKHKVSSPLEVVEAIEEIFSHKSSFTRYAEDDGYIDLAFDIRDRTKTKANLSEIWQAAWEYRDRLRWTSPINVPLGVFETIDELLSEPNAYSKYSEEDGYLLLAREVRRRTDSPANLSQIWSGARKHRKHLAWPAKYECPLEMIETMQRLMKAPDALSRFAEDDGYIEMARTIRKETGQAANLQHVWSAARKYREKLRWSQQISLPFSVFEKMDELLSDKANHQKYSGNAGYIQLARDLKEITGTASHLAGIWAGARKYREELAWNNKIDLPLAALDKINSLLKRNKDKYYGEFGCVDLARDLRASTGYAANLSYVFAAVSAQMRKSLEWTSRISLPLDDFDQLHQLFSKQGASTRYHGQQGYIKAVRDLAAHKKSDVDMADVWSAAGSLRRNFQWDDAIRANLSLYDEVQQILSVGSQLQHYSGQHGYIDLARELQTRMDKSVDLEAVWSSARTYRSQLGWNQISMSLDTYTEINVMLGKKGNKQKYSKEPGYVQLARDLKERTGLAPNLADIWTAAKDYRDERKWPGPIKLSLEAYEKMHELLTQPNSKGMYGEEAGLIQLVRDIHAQTSAEPSIGNVWMTARKYRNGLDWPDIIELTLPAYDALQELVTNPKNEKKYSQQTGYISLGRDLEQKLDSPVRMEDIWLGAQSHRNRLNWGSKLYGSPANPKAKP